MDGAAPEQKDGLPILDFPSQGAWEEWLAAQPPTARGLWLKLAKQGSGIATVAQTEAIESALCYGWIDGQGGKFDAEYWLIRFTPRGPQSRWSAINRDRAVKLIESGRMQPAGLRQVERAQADGRWARAYAPPSTATPPDDLAAALAANPEAQTFFEGLDSANRYAIIYRIGDAKKPETRARRIEQHIAVMLRGETLYPRKGK